MLRKVDRLEHSISIIKKRLIIAKSLLISGASIKSAYISSGFYDYSNFMKSFKAEFRISPKQANRSREDKYRSSLEI